MTWKVLADMPGGDLTPEMTTLALGIGLIFSLTCYLLTNLSPGGMITPGWLGVIMVEAPSQGLIIAGGYGARPSC